MKGSDIDHSGQMIRDNPGEQTASRTSRDNSHSIPDPRFQIRRDHGTSRPLSSSAYAMLSLHSRAILIPSLSSSMPSLCFKHGHPHACYETRTSPRQLDALPMPGSARCTPESMCNDFSTPSRRFGPRSSSRRPWTPSHRVVTMPFLAYVLDSARPGRIGDQD